MIGLKKNCNMILTEKQQNYQHCHLENWSVKYLTVEEIRTVIEQVKFLYYPLGKAFEKQIKAIEYQEEKQIKALENHEKQLVKCNSFS